MILLYAIGILGSLCSFIPVMLGDHFNINASLGVPLSDALNDSNFLYFLMLCIGATLPIFLELIYELIKKTHSKHSLHELYDKFALWLPLGIPNIVIFFVICPYQQYEMIPSVFSARHIMVVAAALSALSRHGGHIWTPKICVSTFTPYVLFMILSPFKSFHYSRPTIESFGMLLQIAAGVFFFPTCYRWFKYIKKSNFENLTIDEYISTVYTGFLLLLFICFVIFQLYYAKVPWYQYESKQLIILTALYLMILIMFIFLNNHLSRQQVCVILIYVMLYNDVKY